MAEDASAFLPAPLTQRGRGVASDWAPRVMATLHPSALLRIREEERRQAEYRLLVADLRMAAV